MHYTLKTDKMKFSILDRGLQIASARNNAGHEFIWQANPDFWGAHGPLLFPICARAYNDKYTFEKKNMS